MSTLTCGVDEAGRGPLAGAVFAAAVILNPDRPIAGLADSKTLSATRREALSAQIQSQALAWGIATSSEAEIDRINILQASLLAMHRAVLAMQAQFAITPSLVQVDGQHCPPLELPCQAIIGGDARVEAISAASILAKVARDASMIELDKRYPEYGFAAHKGYPTAQHLQALLRFGASPVHRKSYAPVQRVLGKRSLA